MKSSFQKTFITIASLITLVVFSAWGYFLYVVKANQEEISSLSQSITNEKDKDNRLTSVRSLTVNTGSDIKKLDSIFVPFDSVAGFVELIEREASESSVDVSIGSLNLDDKKDVLIKSLVLHIEVSGSWSNVTRFLVRLEHLPKIIGINKVIMTRSDDKDTKSRMWKLQTDVMTYVLK
jgi:Tfp pilus assembly protein PilO